MRILHEPKFLILYGQLFVANLRTRNTLIEPTEAEVRQSFAWRNGLISLMTPFDGGTVDLQVFYERDRKLSSSPNVSVNVPHLVPSGETVVIAGHTEEFELTLPGEGRSILYEVSSCKARKLWIRLYFLAAACERPEVWGRGPISKLCFDTKLKP